MHWWLPLKGSTFAGEVDGLFLAITIITGIAFVLVEVGLIWFVVKYRQRPGQKAFYTHGNTRAEVIWTTIPAVTMVALGLISNHYWVKIKGRHSVPANAYPIAIHAKQFEWQVTYPGADGQLGTSDDFTVRNQLHVPVGRPVVVHLSSEDVIHSFFVPVFRVKQDAVPGMDINAWFQARVPGTYELGCAEQCGLGHYRMRAQVVVHTQEDYDAWMKQAAQEASQSRPLPRRRTQHTRITTTGASSGSTSSRPITRSSGSSSCSLACSSCWWAGSWRCRCAGNSPIPGSRCRAAGSSPRAWRRAGSFCRSTTSSWSRCTARSWCSSPSCRCSWVCTRTS